MKLPILKEPIGFNIFLVIISVIFGCFSLLFGIAHIIEGLSGIIEGRESDVPIGEQFVGWAFVIFLTVIGVGLMILALASSRGITYMINKKKNKAKQPES